LRQEGELSFPVRRKRKACAYVLAGEVREIFQNLRFRHTASHVLRREPSFSARECTMAAALSRLDCNYFSVIHNILRARKAVTNRGRMGLRYENGRLLKKIVVHFAGLEFVAHNDAGAAVPAEDRVVGAGGADSFGALEPIHCLTKEFVGG
jgi:hypothetical protein